MWAKKQKRVTTQQGTGHRLAVRPQIAVRSTLVLRGWPKLAQCGLRLAQQARVIVDFTL